MSYKCITIVVMVIWFPQQQGMWLVMPISYKDTLYQAFCGLRHYNLSETGSFLIRKLNQPTRCLMSQSKGKNTLKQQFNRNFR